MKKTAQKIRELIHSAVSEFSTIDPDEAENKISPNKWSKKEILGHLIDSVANNHQRCVRAGYNVADQFPPYNQNEWVRIQQYNKISWHDLIHLWSVYNQHLCHVIDSLPNESKSTPCNIGKEEPVTLEFVVTDYLKHLRHHIGQILGRIV